MKVTELLREDSSEFLIEAADEDMAFATAFANKNGIHSKKAIESILTLAQLHHGYLKDVAAKAREGDVFTVSAGEKFLSNKQFFDLVAKLRKELRDNRSSRPLSAGTRFIMVVIDPKELIAVKDFVKTFNKANSDKKLKLGIYDRPANKVIKMPYKKLWIDGSPDSINSFKKQFDK
jgi:hypothetical protein